MAIFITFPGFFLNRLQEPLRGPCNHKELAAVIFRRFLRRKLPSPYLKDSLFDIPENRDCLFLIAEALTHYSFTMANVFECEYHVHKQKILRNVHSYLAQHSIIYYSVKDRYA